MKRILSFLCLLCLFAYCNAADWRAPFTQKILQPGEAISSLQGELSESGEVHWKIDCTSELEASLSFYDIVGKFIETRVLPAKEGTLLPTDEPASFVLTLKNIGTEPMSIGYLGVESASKRTPFKTASWIWAPKLGETPGAYAIFRNNFKIDDIQELDSAFFYVTADDRVSTYVNNTLFEGPHAGGYDVSDSFSVLGALKNGSNTITCRVLNGGGPGGLLCELHLIFKNGRKQIIPSSSGWKCGAVKANDNWKGIPAQDDPVSLGMAGCAPWGNLFYFPVTQFTARLTGLGLPREADETTVWTPRPTMRLAGNDNVFGADCLLTIRLRNNRTDMLADTVIPKATLEALKDGPQTIELNPIHFTYIPDGTYTVEVKLDNAILITETLHNVVVKRSPDQPHGLPAVKLVDQELIPQFLVDDTVKIPVTQYLVDPAGSKALSEQQRAFRAGIQTLWIHHVIQYDQDGNPDFSNLDQICLSALARSPQVYFVVNPALDCVQSPTMTKFFEENPDELCQNDRGETGIYNDPAPTVKPVKCNSMASQKWLKEAERVLGLLIDHLENTPYGRHVVCIAPSSGITWEWMYWGSERLDECADYSTPFLLAFQDYLKQKYQTLDALSKAWRRPISSFSEVKMPTFDDRRVHPETDFLDPVLHTNLMDLYDFIAKVISDDIIRLCSFIKTRTQGRTLTAVYYGYYNMITPPRWMQGSGHWALSKILASDAVDMIQAPSTYNERGPGEPGGFMPPESAINAAGKVLVDESDIRTLHTTSALGRCATLQESRGVIEREWGMCLANNVAYRYYDFSLGWVFSDTRLVDLVKKLNQAEEEIRNAQPRLRAPEDAIAVVISENSMPLLSYHSSLNSGFIAQQYRQFPRIGTAFKVYITPGLQNIPREHKVWFFENPYKMSQEEIDFVKTELLQPGKTVIFGYGTNILDGDSFTSKTLNEFTGLNFALDYNANSTIATLTEEGNQVLGNPPVQSSTPTVPFSPKFYPMGECKILAKDTAGNTVLAETEVNGCRVIFSTLHTLPASWLRSIARQAGLMVFNETEGDITWASGDVVTVHTPAAGPRVLRTRHETGVAKNLLTGQELPVADGQFSYDAREKGTDIFLVK